MRLSRTNPPHGSFEEEGRDWTLILEKSKQEHGCSSVNRVETKERPGAEPDYTSSTLDPPLT